MKLPRAPSTCILMYPHVHRTIFSFFQFEPIECINPTESRTIRAAVSNGYIICNSDLQHGHSLNLLTFKNSLRSQPIIRAGSFEFQHSCNSGATSKRLLQHTRRNFRLKVCNARLGHTSSCRHKTESASRSCSPKSFESF